MVPVRLMGAHARGRVSYAFSLASCAKFVAPRFAGCNMRERDDRLPVRFRRVARGLELLGIDAHSSRPGHASNKADRRHRPRTKSAVTIRHKRQVAEPRVSGREADNPGSRKNGGLSQAQIHVPPKHREDVRGTHRSRGISPKYPSWLRKRPARSLHVDLDKRNV